MRCGQRCGHNFRLVRYLAHRFGGRGSQSRSIQSAQRLVEGCNFADLRMIRKQREHIVVPAQGVLDKSLQGFLRSGFDKHARARVVERV